MYKHFIFCVQFIHSHINKHTGTHTYTCTQKRFSSLFSERTCRSFWHVIEKCWKTFGCTNIFYIGDYILYIYIYIYIYNIYIYVHIYLYMHIYIYMQSGKGCALPVITTMALWQLMHLATWCTVTHCLYQWTKECSTSQARA